MCFSPRCCANKQRADSQGAPGPKPVENPGSSEASVTFIKPRPRSPRVPAVGRLVFMLVRTLWTGNSYAFSLAEPGSGCQ